MQLGRGRARARLAKSRPMKLRFDTTSARSLEGWRIERSLRADREASITYASRSKKLRCSSAEQALVQSAERKQASERRYAQFKAEIDKLREFPPQQRLSYLASETALPLEVIPPDLIADCIPMAHSTDQETRQLLLRRIGRRQSRPWKALRAALTDPTYSGGRDT
jgi:hypothetical protein